jgi:hypothetical protein
LSLQDSRDILSHALEVDMELVGTRQVFQVTPEPFKGIEVRVRGPSRYRHRTPAMAAGLTGQRWLVRKLLLMPLLPEGHISRSLLAA